VQSNSIIRLLLALLVFAGLGLTINRFMTPVAAKTAPFACTFTVSPLTNSVQAAANTFQASVGVSASFPDILCSWIAQSNDNWLQVAPPSGITNGSVTVIVGANHGPQRTGHVTIAGKTVTVTQASGCTFTASPLSADFSETGGNGVINMTPSAAGCTY